MHSNNIIYKIAIASFLHDIGKFAERAEAVKDSKEKDKLTVGFHINESFVYQYKDKYLPKDEGKYTHRHAIFTAAFIDHIEKCLPIQFNSENWGIGDSFVELAAGHHKPETPLQWIIAIADRVSSAFEREEFENYNKEKNVRDYKLCRLVPILENISLTNEIEKNNIEDFKYFYPLKELNPIYIYPRLKEEDPHDKHIAAEEYRNLFFNFINDLEKLEHKDNIPLWFDHFDSLFMIYATNIPAATVGIYVPDTSLYDHSRMTSALASALYLYHSNTNSLDENSINNYDEKKFLIVRGDFFGIQNYILSESAINYGAAKLLRGRSFQVALITELIANIICEELNLTSTSIVFNAAGQFTIIAPNLKSVKEKIKEIENKIIDWFYKNFYCESLFGIVYQEASCNDFIKQDLYTNLWQKLHNKLDYKKYNKIDIEKYGGVIEGYLDSFNNTLDRKLCPFCGKRPSVIECEGDPNLGEIKSSCKICRDQIFIGKNLIHSYRIAIIDAKANIYDEKLKEPILGRYQIIFIKEKEDEKRIVNYIKHGHLVKYWDISLPGEKTSISKDIAIKWINAYVPRFSEEDINEPLYQLCLDKEAKIEIDQFIKNREIKTFSDIALSSMKCTNGQYEGLEALGILKADVDRLGSIFSQGVKRKNLSKSALLSRQINSFFSFYIPYLLNTDKEYRNIYTVFSGGDDLFLIGPWNTIIKFAADINKKFKDYVCQNKDITISMGIVLSKGSEPVFTYAQRIESALKASKSAENKNSITLFNETIQWDGFLELNNIKERLSQWLNKEYINNAMLFRFNEFLNQAQIEKEILSNQIKSIGKSELESLKWRSFFKYTLARNVAKNLKKSERIEVIKEIEEVAKWLIEYGSKFKIPLWQIIYEIRKIRR